MRDDPTTLITCEYCSETIIIAFHVYPQAYGRDWQREENEESQELEENNWMMEVEDFKQKHYCPECKEG